MSYGTNQPILFIDEIPIGDMKQLEEISGNIEEEFDMPEIESLRKGFEGTFEVRAKQSTINKIFRPCFGREPYVSLEKCSKCMLKKDCVTAKIENNFNRR